MTVECVGAPFTYRWPDGEVHLSRGRPVDLPDDRAARLLAKAPGWVRVVEPMKRRAGPLAGLVVTWDSPLFGLLSATVDEDFAHGVRVIHPLTEVPCVIPMAWLRLTSKSHHHTIHTTFPDKIENYELEREEKEERECT